jgi:hypothetical protein
VGIVLRTLKLLTAQAANQTESAMKSVFSSDEGASASVSRFFARF